MERREEARKGGEARSVVAQRLPIQVPYRRDTVEQRKERPWHDDGGHLHERHLPAIGGDDGVMEHRLEEWNAHGRIEELAPFDLRQRDLLEVESGPRRRRP